MVKGRVSVIIPSRNERHLNKTISSLLANAAGDVEVLVMLDGGVPEVEPIMDDKRIRVLRRRVDATHEAGMRYCINEGAQAATGQYLMKCDAHCIFGHDYDAYLKAECDGNWLVVPTRHSIHPSTWTVKVRDYNYHYLTFPYDLSMYGYGLHAKTFETAANRDVNAAREHIAIDDLMSFQGSCWFQHTANFHRLGPLDHGNYYFYQEAQEVGLRQWMTGGRCVINKRTWYAHLHKGKEEGRGFYLSLKRKRQSEAYATDFWLNDKWPDASVTWVDFVGRFQWLLDRLTGSDRWPSDWATNIEKYRQAFYTRPEDQTPAHI